MNRCIQQVIAALSVVVAGCAESPTTNLGPPPTEEERWPEPDSIEAAPAPECPNRTLADMPILALPWGSNTDTYLPPGMAPAALAFDYSVSPRAHVTRVSVEYDFDDTIAPEAWAMDEVCPDVLPFDALAPGDEELVGRATISAEAAYGSVRRGRVNYSRGSASATVRVAELALPDDAPWWLLFEPAAGDRRVAIVPVATDRATATITDIPDEPGTLALVQSARLEVSAETGVIYAPGAFGTSWRTGGPWYASPVASPTDEATVDAPLLLAPYLLPGEEPMLLRAEFVATEAVGAQMFRTTARAGEATLRLPCAASRVTLRTDGFARVTASAGDQSRTVEPLGGPVRLAFSCATGDTDVAVTVTYEAVNARPVTLVVAWGAE